MQVLTFTMHSLKGIILTFKIVNYVAGKNHSIMTKWNIHAMICLENNRWQTCRETLEFDLPHAIY